MPFCKECMAWAPSSMERCSQCGSPMPNVKPVTVRHAARFFGALFQGEAPDADDEDPRLGWTVEEVLASLTERESAVLRLRYGTDDGRARTLAEVGTAFPHRYLGKMRPLSDSRIQQIEKKALRKLRHPSRARKFAWYIRSRFPAEPEEQEAIE